MEAQRAKRREELRSPGAGERACERDGGRPICIVMQGAGARGRVEKVAAFHALATSSQVAFARLPRRDDICSRPSREVFT